MHTSRDRWKTETLHTWISIELTHAVLRLWTVQGLKKKSPLPVTLEGLILIIERGKMIPKRTVSQLQNLFWEWEKPVKRHYPTAGVTSSNGDLYLLWTRIMMLQKYVPHRLWVLNQYWVCTQRLMKSRYLLPESGDHLSLLICLMTRLKCNSLSFLS